MQIAIGAGQDECSNASSMHFLFTLYNADSLGSVMATTKRQAEYLAQKSHRVTVVGNTDPAWNIDEFIQTPPAEGLVRALQYVSNGVFRRMPSYLQRFDTRAFLAQKQFCSALHRVLASHLQIGTVDGLVCCQHFCSLALKGISTTFGVPYVVVAHGDVFTHPPSSFPRLLYGFYETSAIHAYEHASHVVAVSRALADRANEFGRDQAQTTVIPNGIEEADVALGANRWLAKNRGSACRLLCVGRLSPEKSVRTLLEAIAALKEDSVLLEVVGDGPEMATLIRQAAALGLTEKVRFRGALPRRELGKFYQDADVIVLPSLSEAQPLVTLEAAIAGRPIVASNVGGVPDVVKHNITGLLVPPGNPGELSKAISRLANSPDERSRFGQAARARSKEFAWANVLASFARTLENLCG